MKLKRAFAFLLVWMLLMQCVPFASAAENNNIAKIVAEDAERNQKIDELFAERMRLEHNYDDNRAEIDAIDQQLMQLGVEMLSKEEAAPWVDPNGLLPLWEAETTSTIQWTTRKLVTTYRGYHFEMRIFEGVPIATGTTLQKTYSQVSYEAEGIQAGITNAVAVTATNIAAEFLTGALAVGVTVIGMLADGAEEIKESLSTSTVLDRVEGTALISLAGHMKYIYVKPYETSDSRFELYYFGNTVSSVISTLSEISMIVDGQLVVYHDVEANVSDTIQSQFYDDYSKAAANYWDYNYNHNDNYTQDYTVYFLDLEIFGNTDVYSMPWANHPNIIF